MPLEVEVDRELKLVETEATPLCAVLTPVEADVERDATLLLVVDRPVESETTPL